jgi:hypothetical protein
MLFGIRLYLALVWSRFGLTKLRAGWLDGWLAGQPFRHANPLRPLFELIAAGQLPTPFGLYRPIAGMLLAAHADALLAALIPLTEIILAIAFVVGIAPRRWAGAALFVNANLMLSGLGSVGVDGPVMALEVLLVAGAWLASRLYLATRSSRGRAPLASWPETTTVPTRANDRNRLSHLSAAGQHHPEPAVHRGLA